MDITTTILADIASEPGISARAIRLDESRKGFLKKKKVLRICGTVASGAQKDRVLKLAQERAGEEYLVMDSLFVSEVLWDG